MHATGREATALVTGLKEKINGIEGVEKVVCPPFISLTATSRLIRNSSIKLGAQNVHHEEKGPYTGEISPVMLVDLCQYVILGHSERRQHFCETDEIVNRKVRAVIKIGLTPILCVGEKLEENEAGRTAEVVKRQVWGAFAEVGSPQGTVIAYEPIWAIGTGKAATGNQANNTISVIRQEVAAIYDSKVAGEMRILYGGSVTGANIAEFVSQPDVDGALVGGASLKALEFINIIQQTAGMKRNR